MIEPGLYSDKQGRVVTVLGVVDNDGVGNNRVVHRDSAGALDVDDEDYFHSAFSPLQHVELTDYAADLRTALRDNPTGLVQLQQLEAQHARSRQRLIKELQGSTGLSALRERVGQATAKLGTIVQPRDGVDEMADAAVAYAQSLLAKVNTLESVTGDVQAHVDLKDAVDRAVAALSGAVTGVANDDAPDIESIADEAAAQLWMTRDTLHKTEAARVALLADVRVLTAERDKAREDVEDGVRVNEDVIEDRNAATAARDSLTRDLRSAEADVRKLQACDDTWRKLFDDAMERLGAGAKSVGLLWAIDSMIRERDNLRAKAQEVDALRNRAEDHAAITQAQNDAAAARADAANLRTELGEVARERDELVESRDDLRRALTGVAAERNAVRTELGELAQEREGVRERAAQLEAARRQAAEDRDFRQQDEARLVKVANALGIANATGDKMVEAITALRERDSNHRTALRSIWRACERAIDADVCRKFQGTSAWCQACGQLQVDHVPPSTPAGTPLVKRPAGCEGYSDVIGRGVCDSCGQWALAHVEPARGDQHRPPVDTGNAASPSAKVVRRELDSDADGVCRVCRAPTDCDCDYDEVAHRQHRQRRPYEGMPTEAEMPPISPPRPDFCPRHVCTIHVRCRAACRQCGCGYCRDAMWAAARSRQ